MSYATRILFKCTPANSGLTGLRVQLVDDAGADVGAPITGACVELAAGSGEYLAVFAVPDGHGGAAKLFKSDGTTFLTAASINPPELENADVKTGTRATPDDVAGGSNVGPGADAVTVTVAVGGSPVPDADVWITSDALGATVVAGTLQTDSAGEATFLLDAGATYYLWMQKDGVNPIRGESFVAVAD